MKKSEARPAPQITEEEALAPSNRATYDDDEANAVALDVDRWADQACTD